MSIIESHSSLDKANTHRGYGKPLDESTKNQPMAMRKSVKTYHEHTNLVLARSLLLIDMGTLNMPLNMNWDRSAAYINNKLATRSLIIFNIGRSLRIFIASKHIDLQNDILSQ